MARRFEVIVAAIVLTVTNIVIVNPAFAQGEAIIARLPNNGQCAAFAHDEWPALSRSDEQRPAFLEAVSERIRHDVLRGWAAGADRDSSGLQHSGRDLDVDPDHPAAA